MADFCMTRKIRKIFSKWPGYLIVVLVILLAGMSALFFYCSASGRTLINRSEEPGEETMLLPSARGIHSSLPISDTLSLELTEYSVDGKILTLTMRAINSESAPCELSSSQFELEFQDQNNPEVYGYASPESFWTWTIPGNDCTTTTQKFLLPSDAEASYTLNFYLPDQSKAGQIFLFSGETVNNC